MTIEQTLKERGKRYGDFASHAQISQAIFGIIMSHIRLPISEEEQDAIPVIQEATAMVCNKFGRIANGNPLYADSWRDAAGYCMLVANYLEENYPDHQ